MLSNSLSPDWLLDSSCDCVVRLLSCLKLWCNMVCHASLIDSVKFFLVLTKVLCIVVCALVTFLWSGLFQGKHRDNTPYGEYGGWYKACKVNRYHTQRLKCMKATFLIFVNWNGNVYLNHQSYCEHHSEEFGCSVPPTRQDGGCGDPGGVCHEIPQAGQIRNNTERCLNLVEQ